MYKKTVILGMYAETPVHAGCGTATGAIDLPVQREKHTDWPTIQASGLKGAFRDAYEKRGGNDATAIFGSEESGEQAGAVSIGDARILLFPVRASKAPFLWVTCPAVLRKLKRDKSYTGTVADWSIPEVSEDGYVGLNGESVDVIFEDLLLKGKGSLYSQIVETLKSFIPDGDQYDKNNFENMLSLVSDENFSLLVRTATEVQARIELDDDKKTSKNLWYQELLPSNSVLYTMVSVMDERNPKDDRKESDALLKSLRGKLADFIQVGGDETLGRGWMKLVWQEEV